MTNAVLEDLFHKGVAMLAALELEDWSGDVTFYTDLAPSAAAQFGSVMPPPPEITHAATHMMDFESNTTEAVVKRFHCHSYYCGASLVCQLTAEVADLRPYACLEPEDKRK